MKIEIIKAGNQFGLRRVVRGWLGRNRHELFNFYRHDWENVSGSFMSFSNFWREKEVVDIVLARLAPEIYGEVEIKEEAE